MPNAVQKNTEGAKLEPKTTPWVSQSDIGICCPNPCHVPSLQHTIKNTDSHYTQRDQSIPIAHSYMYSSLNLHPLRH